MNGLELKYEQVVVDVNKEKSCLCKKDFMSICNAASESEQKNCTFYRKSSRSDRCMYFVLDGYCDCLEAQIETQFEAEPEYHWI
jgi:hypothetical protein